MRCPQCDAEIGDESLFCPKCGEQLQGLGADSFAELRDDSFLMSAELRDEALFVSAVADSAGPVSSAFASPSRAADLPKAAGFAESTLGCSSASGGPCRPRQRRRALAERIAKFAASAAVSIAGVSVAAWLDWGRAGWAALVGALGALWVCAFALRIKEHDSRLRLQTEPISKQTVGATDRFSPENETK